ncbi:alpha-keto acid decarboxylase family protein [Cetobacterium sp. SF1]|uniref:alpha-keto acid decarboxylase family protein n=1 Tax=Cetobacterium sp. SF1 TaxID=3417654 RepID=UPI003CF9DF5E
MKMTIGNYLIYALKKYNVKHIFGVPGDYNLSFLDQIEDSEDIQWIGNCNELNAAYAADGYGRINGMGVVVTTFGPGELSAINGIAGSFAEKVPVVKIVGRPSFNLIENKKNVHHTLGNQNFEIFYDMFKNITGAQTILNVRNAQMEIDRVLNICFVEKVPVYIELPSDLANFEIDIIENNNYSSIKSDLASLNSFIKNLSLLLQSSKGQAILADFEINRYKLEKELNFFIESAKIPCTTLSMGKGVINESSPYFIGTYNGILSNKLIKEVTNNTDLLLMIGATFTDSTTAGFSMINKDINLIEIHPYFSKINNKIYNNILLEDVLEEMKKLNFNNSTSISLEIDKLFIPKNIPLTQKYLFKILQHSLKENDILLAEQGTSFFGASEIILPKNSLLVGQPLWGSIGYTLGALLGTQLADTSRRNILLIGDGSLQLTVQEISTILRHKLKPIIMVINNDGYTVEKLIHGPNRNYNSINMWDYKKLPETLNLSKNSYKSLDIRTDKELIDALASYEDDKLLFLELHLNSEDAPDILVKLGQLFKKENNY